MQFELAFPDCLDAFTQLALQVLERSMLCSQCRVLVYLQRNEGISQVRLAYLTDTDPMTLVRILDRMESDGWLERRLDPADRRARRLYLKPNALPVLKQIWTIGDRSRNEALVGLEAGQRSQLLDLLERVHDNLNTLLPGNAEPLRHLSTPDAAAREGTPRAKRPARGATAVRSKRRRMSS